MTPMAEPASTALLHVYMWWTSLRYRTSCTSEFHWVITLHGMLLHMLAFNFTAHPLVHLTLERIKGITSVTRLLIGTSIKIHLEKDLPCQVAIHSCIFQLVKGIMFISKEKHLAKYLLSDLFTVYYFSLHQLLLAKLPGK